MKRIKKRLTYANVMSSLAVFLVVAGGTAVAANQLAKNSVGANQLKKNAVTAAKIKNGAVTTAKIKNGSVTGAKVNLGSLGPVPSAQSATTAQNATTANAPAGWMHVSGAGKILASGGVGSATVSIGNANYYCIGSLPFNPVGANVTTDYWNGTGTFTTITQFGLASAGGLGGTGCPADTSAFVFGRRAETNTASGAGFYISFWQ